MSNNSIDEIFTKFINDIKNKKISSLYKYIGHFPKNYRKDYSDIIIKYLIVKNIGKLFKKHIIQITRKESYYCSSHKGYQGLTPEKKLSFQEKGTEEQIAKALFQNKYEYIGKIIDYQTPLKNERSENNNKGVGKIDLLAYNDKKRILSLIEFKKTFEDKNKDEPLVRAILEICTYYYQVDKCRLKKDFIKALKIGSIDDIHKVVLVYKNSEQYNDFKKSEENFKSLIKELDVKICFFDGNEVVEVIEAK